MLICLQIKCGLHGWAFYDHKINCVIIVILIIQNQPLLYIYSKWVDLKFILKIYIYSGIHKTCSILFFIYIIRQWLSWWVWISAWITAHIGMLPTTGYQLSALPDLPYVDWLKMYQMCWQQQWQYGSKHDRSCMWFVHTGYGYVKCLTLLLHITWCWPLNVLCILLLYVKLCQVFDKW